MNKLNKLFIIYMIICLLYITIAVYSDRGMKSFILAAAGYLSCCLATIGYGLNGGK